jgi:DNA-binding MarR family transcriptional regulator
MTRMGKATNCCFGFFGGNGLEGLSERVSLAHSTVSGIIDRLEKRGFAERRVLETDRRVTRITASAPVLEFLQKKAPELTLHPLLRALSRASEAERRAVRRGLNTLEKLLGEESGEACPPFSEGERGTRRN